MKLNFGLYVLLIVLISGCKSKPSNSDIDFYPMALKMAKSVVERNDSLIIYNNPNSVKWKYDFAMLGQAMCTLDSGKTYYNYYKDFIDYFVDEAGNIKKYDRTKYNLDYFNPAKGLLKFYKETGDEKYRIAAQTILSQLKNQPRTSDGGYCHKQIYDGQIWLNSTYMYTPFLVDYANTFNKPNWIDTVLFQLQYTYDVTVDPTDGLMYHAWDETRSQSWADPVTGLSPHKWGRGMGWYMMALADVLELMPEDETKHKNLETIFKNTAKALLKVRDDNTKLWYQVLDMGNEQYNYPETSCSAMFIYAFAKGVNIGVLPQKYRDIAVESLQSLINHSVITDTDNRLSLTNISGPAGLGVKSYRNGSFEYYINQKQIDNDAKGVAPFIMAITEFNNKSIN
jgi:unsaturated rhamnogalacturonyl hydrolase